MELKTLGKIEIREDRLGRKKILKFSDCFFHRDRRKYLHGGAKEIMKSDLLDLVIESLLTMKQDQFDIELEFCSDGDGAVEVPVSRHMEHLEK